MWARSHVHTRVVKTGLRGRLCRLPQTTSDNSGWKAYLSDKHYVPTEYWERHLRERPGLLGTGHRRFSLDYNIKMYAAATERLMAAFKKVDISLTALDVLDVGSGFGYWIERYQEWGARTITGVDLTEVAVAQLRERFPDLRFEQADISSPNWRLGSTFGLVSAISMIFHIVDQARFRTALRNLCAHVAPGGHLLIVDAFRPQWLPSAPHARLRDLKAYREILRSEGFDPPRLFPMHYVLGRAFIPKLGPALLNWHPMLKAAAALEDRLGAGPHPPLGWLNYMLARRHA